MIISYVVAQISLSSAAFCYKFWQFRLQNAFAGIGIGMLELQISQLNLNPQVFQDCTKPVSPHSWLPLSDHLNSLTLLVLPTLSMESRSFLVSGSLVSQAKEQLEKTLVVRSLYLFGSESLPSLWALSLHFFWWLGKNIRGSLRWNKWNTPRSLTPSLTSLLWKTLKNR